MDAERWQTLSPLLDALLELDAAERTRSLASLRDEDPRLADDLEGLLALEADGDDFLSQPLIPPMPGPRPGGTVGPYQLDRLLGEGGMGQVWLALRNDGLYQRRVALKLLRPGLADPNLRLRFTRERQILARLEHPHIARLLDAGISSDNQPYLALEYVDGEPLTDWCRSRALSVDACLRLFLQVCEAVSHAHANLIVHRDLKPSNILVTPLDEVRLLDFGIAKLLDTPDQAPDNTRTGLRTFTLHYAAPEQIRGEPVTTMTDVYSLGVVLYELLSGHKPYRLKRNSDAEWEEAILGYDPLRPSVSTMRSGDDSAAGDPRASRRRARQVAGDLDNIVLKALAKTPEQRYASVEALALDLQRHRGGMPVHARPQSMLYRFGKFGHRHRWALATTLLVTMMLASTLGIVAWQTRQSVREGARAQALQDFVVGLFENAGSTPAGTPLDVRQLLDAGLQRGDRELSQQPVSRAELYGVISRLRVGLGDYEQALALQLRQRDLIASLGGSAPDSLRLESVTDMGRTLRMLGRHDDCVRTMAPLQSSVRREERPFPAKAAEYYTQLARCQTASPQRARSLFERSLALRRDPLNDQTGIVENLGDLAGLRAQEGDTAGAEIALRAATEQLHARVGYRQPLAIDMRRRLCALQRTLADIKGAERDCRAALALSLELLGPQHRSTIDARRQLAALLVDEGRFNEASIEFNDAQAWLLTHLGLQHEDVARNDNSLAIVAWELGDIDTALGHSRRAIATARDTRSGLLPGQLFNRAMILHSVARDAEARPLLQEALRLRRAMGGNQSASLGDTLRLLGEVDAVLGDDPALALRELQEATTATQRGYGVAHPQAQRAVLALAQLQAASGEPAALATLQRIAAQPDTDIELRKIVWLARAQLAALDCRGPRRAQAREAFALLLPRLQAAQPEGGALVREITALRDGCFGSVPSSRSTARHGRPLQRSHAGPETEAVSRSTAAAMPAAVRSCLRHG